MKFPIKNTTWGGYYLFKEVDTELIILSDIVLHKQQHAHLSFCNQRDHFDYKKYQKVLCGSLGNSSPFGLKRILVLQFI